MTHICVSKLTIIDSDNGLSHGRRQAIIWTNVGILLIKSLGTNFSEISIVGIQTFSFKKMHLKMSAKWCPFCLGLIVSNGHPSMWRIYAWGMFKKFHTIFVIKNAWIINNAAGIHLANGLAQIYSRIPHLNPWWPRSMISYCFTRPQWVNTKMGLVQNYTFINRDLIVWNDRFFSLLTWQWYDGLYIFIGIVTKNKTFSFFKHYHKSVEYNITNYSERQIDF